MRFALYSETEQTRLGFVLLALSAIKTKSTSSKCTYVLNGNSKSTGETAQMDTRFEHAMKTNIDCSR